MHHTHLINSFVVHSCIHTYMHHIHLFHLFIIYSSIIYASIHPFISFIHPFHAFDPSDLTHSLTLWQPDLSLPRTILWKTSIQNGEDRTYSLLKVKSRLLG